MKYKVGGSLAAPEKVDKVHPALPTNSTMSTDEKNTVPKDIIQEAMRRVAENKRKAEEEEKEAAREKAILAHMQKLKYDALPKCAHGVPENTIAWRDHCVKHPDFISVLNMYKINREWEDYYCSHIKYYHINPSGFIDVGRYPIKCATCVDQLRVNKEKEKAEQAAAVAAEAKRITMEQAAERERLYEIARSKKIEDKTAQLKNNKAILNFVGLDKARGAEIYYLRLESGGKYVPFVDFVESLQYPSASPLWNTPHGTNVYMLHTPSQWASHFTEGLIPFLPVCPCCAKPTRMCAADSGPYSAPRYIGSVMCAEFDNVSTKFIHYKWEASTGKHYKHGVVWDPTDPDGVKAAAQRRAAELVAAEAQMVELQAKIQRLRAETI